MQSFKHYHTIEEVFSSVRQIDSNLQTTILIEGYSPHTEKSLKKLIVLCNSIAINLVQQEKHEEALLLLQTSDKADADLCQCSENSLFWQGRLITPSILSYLYLTQQRQIDSLKFIYKAHSLAQQIKDSGSSVHAHIRNLMNVLTFMILWKMGKYLEAEKYIETVKEYDMETVKGKNLLGITMMAKSAILVRLKKEYLAAINFCEETIERLEHDEISCELIKGFINSLYSELNKQTRREEILVTDKFSTFFFVTCFMPLIAPGTPLVKSDPKVFKKTIAVVKRPAHSASRTRSEIPGLEKLRIADLNLSDFQPLTSRRSRQATSRERIVNAKPIISALQISSTKAYSDRSKIAYYSPRIITKKIRPKSSKIPLKNKAYNVYK